MHLLCLTKFGTEPLAPAKNAKQFAEGAAFFWKWPRPTRKTINARLKLTISWQPIKMRRRTGATRRSSKRDFVWEKKLIALPHLPAFTRFSMKECAQIGHMNFSGFTRRVLMRASC